MRAFSSVALVLAHHNSHHGPNKSQDQNQGQKQMLHPDGRIRKATLQRTWIQEGHELGLSTQATHQSDA